MKSVLCLFLSCLTLPVFAQEHNLHGTYINRKTIAVGYTHTGISVGRLNAMLLQSGYKPLDPSIGTITFSVGTDFGPRWGVFYSADIGLINNQSSSSRYQRFQYYRLYSGIEFTALQQDRFDLSGRVAFSYSSGVLRLYDTVADTTSFSRYLSGQADGKRCQAGTWGIDVGFQSRFRISDAIFIGLGAGYILPVGSSEWKHDAGTFESAPAISLGSWYVGVRVGGLFYRRVTRIPSQEFNLNNKRESGKSLFMAEKTI